MRARVVSTIGILGLALAVLASPVAAGEPQPVLVSSKADSPDPILAGGVLTYTITLHNLGPGDVPGVIVEDPIPLGTSFQSLTVTSGSANCCTGGVLAVWQPADIPEGGLEVMTLVVLVDPGVAPGAVIINTAQVDALGQQTQISVETTVAAPPTPTPVASNLPNAAMDTSADTSPLLAFGLVVLIIGSLAVLAFAAMVVLVARRLGAFRPTDPSTASAKGAPTEGPPPGQVPPA